MAMLATFTPTEKAAHNSHKFGFSLSPTNYGYWKTMVQPFFVTNKLFDYIDGTIPCPPKNVSSSEKDEETQSQTPNPNYINWVSNDVHIRMLLISTIFEASFQHVQGLTSCDLWLSLERAYAPYTSSREYTLKTQLLRLQMKQPQTT
ncbi:uncharacterized protein [Rutidosis leptorrhynchoides]|uniref:uncharacterized protein n=1 Tax=Rutidosis leptorrhynchoides TaxID=125765 RepID=UPI003A999ED2